MKVWLVEIPDGGSGPRYAFVWATTSARAKRHMLDSGQVRVIGALAKGDPSLDGYYQSVQVEFGPDGRIRRVLV